VPNAPSDVDPALPAAVTTPEPPPPVPKGATAPEGVERGGPAGPEPTRFGDWERNGRCIDF